MTADAPPAPALERRSPLGAVSAVPMLIAAGDGIEIRERPFASQLLLRVTPEEPALAAVERAIGLRLTVTPRLVRSPGAPRLAFWMGPDEWLIVDAPDSATAEDALAEAVLPHGGTVVDVSAHRTFLELTGPRARDILSAGSSVDFHPRTFDVSAVAQTQLARVDVIIGRGAADTYLLAVRASFAHYLVDWLRDALAGD